MTRVHTSNPEETLYSLCYKGDVEGLRAWFKRSGFRKWSTERQAEALDIAVLNAGIGLKRYLIARHRELQLVFPSDNILDECSSYKFLVSVRWFDTLIHDDIIKGLKRRGASMKQLWGKNSDFLKLVECVWASNEELKGFGLTSEEVESFAAKEVTRAEIQEEYEYCKKARMWAAIITCGCACIYAERENWDF